MVRKYVRKRPTPWRDKDKRMAAAVRKRAEGKSLREIAVELAVSAPTVMRDLRRWDELQAARPQNVFQMPVTNNPPRGEMKQPSETAGVTPLRKVR